MAEADIKIEIDVDEWFEVSWTETYHEANASNERVKSKKFIEKDTAEVIAINLTRTVNVKNVVIHHCKEVHK